MNRILNERRNFIKTAGLGAGGLLLGVPTATFSDSAAYTDTKSPHIETPFHGAVLNHRHGKQVANGMIVRVVGQADADEKVTVNGLSTLRKGKAFEADIILRQKETTITAATSGISRQHEIRVVWDRYSRPRYGFASLRAATTFSSSATLPGRNRNRCSTVFT